MEPLYSRKLQDLTNTFFGKTSDANCHNTIRWDGLEDFNQMSDAVLHQDCRSETNQFDNGFDLGVKYAQQTFDANMNGKPPPGIYLVCAPHTNHYFLGTEKEIAAHLQSAIEMLEHEKCICTPGTLFLHGCGCSAPKN